MFCKNKSVSIHAILELYKTIKKLRSENGCPWDKNQTSESLSQYILQEAYEVLESIDNNGENLSEELGDLLFQIIIQSVIAEEKFRPVGLKAFVSSAILIAVPLLNGPFCA